MVHRRNLFFSCATFNTSILTKHSKDNKQTSKRQHTFESKKKVLTLLAIRITVRLGNELFFLALFYAIILQHRPTYYFVLNKTASVCPQVHFRCGIPAAMRLKVNHYNDIGNDNDCYNSTFVISNVKTSL